MLFHAFEDARGLVDNCPLKWTTWVVCTSWIFVVSSINFRGCPVHGGIHLFNDLVLLDSRLASSRFGNVFFLDLGLSVAMFHAAAGFVTFVAISYVIPLCSESSCYTAFVMLHVLVALAPQNMANVLSLGFFLPDINMNPDNTKLRTTLILIPRVQQEIRLREVVDRCANALILENITLVWCFYLHFTLAVSWRSLVDSSLLFNTPRSTCLSIVLDTAKFESGWWHNTMLVLISWWQPKMQLREGVERCRNSHS